MTMAWETLLASPAPLVLGPVSTEGAILQSGY
jgi:hypothetical protein